MATFFRCKKCGKIITILNSGSPVTVCCGEEMYELKANTTDGATEKHVPVIEKNGNMVKIKIGSAVHPMEKDHYIQWVAIETDKGVQIKFLSPGQSPEAIFVLEQENLVAAYEYCNKHGLWKAGA